MAKEYGTVETTVAFFRADLFIVGHIIIVTLHPHCVGLEYCNAPLHFTHAAERRYCLSSPLPPALRVVSLSLRALGLEPLDGLPLRQHLALLRRLRDGPELPAALA